MMTYAQVVTKPSTPPPPAYKAEWHEEFLAKNGGKMPTLCVPLFKK